MTRNSGTFDSLVSTSSKTPPAKKALSGSGLRFSKGITATPRASVGPTSASTSLRVAWVVALTNAASRLGASTKRSKAKNVSARTSTATIWRFIRWAVCGAMDLAGSTSSSRLMPSGVNSNAHANTIAGTKPNASTITSARKAQPGTPNVGNKVLATCTSNHAPTRYSPAMRMTLRRLSSASRLKASPPWLAMEKASHALVATATRIRQAWP